METNRLIEESSPYLLQHAHNPVHWYPWGDEAFNKAESENKVVIISIGYSSCHWCHVMETESFEDWAVAEFMNKNFICIKVDREERPDIDSHYMNALQLITGRGGWPMNMFALPDGRPFYGGSYFPRDQWIYVMSQISEKFRTERESLTAAADSILKGMADHRIRLPASETSDFSLNELSAALKKVKDQFDTSRGGLRGAPKFPMPVLIRFLLNWSVLRKDDTIREFVFTTLDRMAAGGIFDQIGGGFARYSTDENWKIPHFEKMLYDNAQLITLYSQAFSITGNMRYKQVVYQTMQFIREAMTSPEGVFYSALDADSQREEGRYYVWEEKELLEILGEDFPEARRLFGIGTQGLWENGKNILIDTSEKECSAEDRKKRERIGRNLMEVRRRRVPPALDDKSLSSWNGLMISACSAAYNAFGDQSALEAALKAAEFITQKMTMEKGLLHAYRKGKSYIDGFMEDYAHMVSAMISLHETTGMNKFLEYAQWWTQKVMDDFFSQEDFLFYTSEVRESRLQKDTEVADSVLPSANAEMAHNLLRLGALTGQHHFMKKAEEMVSRMSKRILETPLYFSRWTELMLYLKGPFYEVVIVGEDAQSLMKEIRKAGLSNAVYAFSKEGDESSPLFKNRYKQGETLIYICRSNSCGLPLKTVKDALNSMNQVKIQA